MSIIGGVFWLTAMWHKTEASAKDLERIKTDIYTQNLEILQRLSRIEGVLKGKDENK